MAVEPKKENPVSKALQLVEEVCPNTFELSPLGHMVKALVDEKDHSLVLQKRIDEVISERDFYKGLWESASNGSVFEHLARELETLRAHRCEVGMENVEASLEYMKSLPPEELESLNQLLNRDHNLRRHHE